MINISMHNTHKWEIVKYPKLGKIYVRQCINCGLEGASSYMAMEFVYLHYPEYEKYTCKMFYNILFIIVSSQLKSSSHQ
jgi:hypothetical protein